MDASARARWRWAWFCPRCGEHNPAAADQCEGCDLEHALLNAPGPSAVHACGVASPGWAAYCIGCGDPLPPGGAEPPVPPRPRTRTADLPRRPRQPHRILPPSDGPAEGITLSRHVLLERAAERAIRPAPVRVLALALVAAIAFGLLLKALATPGDGMLALARAHQVPSRGFDALYLLEGIHRLLAPAPTGPAWTARIERAERSEKLLVLRVGLRNGGTSSAPLAPGDVHLVDGRGLDVTASGASPALARAANLTPLGDPIGAGTEVTTLVVFDVATQSDDLRLKLPGAEAPIPR